MNKLFFVTTLTCSIFFYNTVMLGMTSATTLGHPDITSNLFPYLDKEDQDDFRLVCKDWANKGPIWNFMPDSVEKEYDRIIKRKRTISIIDQKLILFFLASENDFNAVQWIHNSNKNITNDGLWIENKYITKTAIDAHMFALHNKNCEMAKMLITAHKDYKNQNWKTCYKTISLPKNFLQCLPSSHDRDFSFLPYIVAMFLDNADKLKQLYLQQIPTSLGQNILLLKCAQYNASCALNVILENEAAQKLVKKDNVYLFTHALNYKTKEVAQKLVEKNLYDLNKVIDKKKTILDIYYYDDEYKDNKEAQTILENLGAKTWDDLELEKDDYRCCCLIQ